MNSNEIVNVLLVESHKRTVAWAKALLTLKHINLHVLIVIPDERDVYLELGVRAENIYDIRDASEVFPISNSNLLNFESVSSFGLNAIISLDRLLRKMKNKEALLYLGKLYGYFGKIIDDSNIEVIIYEPTWAHEILMCEVAESKGIKSYFPHTMRLPYQHALFFNGYRQESYFKRKELEFDSFDAQDVYDNVVNKGEKPLYFHKNNNKNNFSSTLLVKPFKNLLKELKGEKNFYVTPRAHKLVFDKILKIIRKPSTSFLVDFYKPKVKDLYVFVSLHVQPESSIDVLGNMYINQIEYVRAISKTTPISHRIYVKEHSNALGDRPISFYKKMAAIPGVVLVDPYLDSHTLMKNADLVISISGTTSFEASLMGVPAVTSAKMFFSGLLVREEFNPYNDSVTSLIKEGENWRKEVDKEILLQNYYRIFKNSFECDTTDCLSNPSVLEKSNVDKLAKAFNEVINNAQ